MASHSFWQDPAEISESLCAATQSSNEIIRSAIKAERIANDLVRSDADLAYFAAFTYQLHVSACGIVYNGTNAIQMQHCSIDKPMRIASENPTVDGLMALHVMRMLSDDFEAQLGPEIALEEVNVIYKT